MFVVQLPPKAALVHSLPGPRSRSSSLTVLCVVFQGVGVTCDSDVSLRLPILRPNIVKSARVRLGEGRKETPCPGAHGSDHPRHQLLDHNKAPPDPIAVPKRSQTSNSYVGLFGLQIFCYTTLGPESVTAAFSSQPHPCPPFLSSQRQTSTGTFSQRAVISDLGIRHLRECPILFGKISPRAICALTKLTLYDVHSGTRGGPKALGHLSLS